MQVVNALEKAGKDFELLVITGTGHGAAETPTAAGAAWIFSSAICSICPVGERRNNCHEQKGSDYRCGCGRTFDGVLLRAIAISAEDGFEVDLAVAQ